MSRLRRLTPAELLDRVRQAALARTEGLPGIGGWVARAGRSTVASVGASVGAVTPFSQLRLLTPEDPAHIARQCTDIDVAAAEAALAGRFDLLGHRALDFGSPVNWHLEPTSGRVSPRLPWKQLDSLDSTLTGDKKVVWELNRHQHLVPLAQSFALTGDEKYARAVIAHIESWIRDNPPGIGINWVSSLELAFRCISWLWALAILRGWDRWGSLPLADISRSIDQQGVHIERFLSTYSSPNTHLTGEALGLYYMGTCMPHLRRASRWRALGRRVLLQQLEFHLQADGVYFEQATWYHRYTADFYTHFLLLAERNDEPLPAPALQRIETLFDYLMWITRPDGSSPYIGDDDGGKLVKLERCAAEDWRGALSNGALLFQRGDFRAIAERLHDESRWLLGSSAERDFTALPAHVPAALSRTFAASGNVIMRSGWDKHAHMMHLDYGPHGVMNCGHSHADALSLELVAKGTTLLVDPGTFSYAAAPTDRELFRSTVMHNTLAIDGESSSVPAGPFKWTQSAHCQMTCWHTHELFSYVTGCHTGYRRMVDTATHSRAVLFVACEYWVMLDSIDAGRDRRVTVAFHFAAGTQVQRAASKRLVTAQSGDSALRVFFADEWGHWDLTDGAVSPCYGAREAAPLATYAGRSNGPLALLSVLVPASSAAPPPTIAALRLAQGTGLSVLTQAHHDRSLHRAASGDGEAIGDNDFEWLWLRRRSKDHSIERVIALHGSRFETDTLHLHCSEQVSCIAATCGGDTLTLDISPPTSLTVTTQPGIQTVIVNGRSFSTHGRSALTIAAADLPAAAASSTFSQQQRCSHVRH